MPVRPDILPDSRPRETKGRVSIKGVTYVPIFCANCGAPGGGVPEEHMTFAFFLCTPCTESHGHVAGMMAVPEEVFWERVKQAQLEEHGRLLTNNELIKEIDDSSSLISKLAREAPKGR